MNKYTESKRHAPLRERCARRRTGHAPADRVYQHPVQRHIHHGAHTRNFERGHGVLQPAQGAHERQNHHHGRNAPQRMVQVVARIADGCVVRAHAAQRRIGKDITHTHNEQTESKRNPHAVHADAVGVRQPMRPERARNRRGHRVCEEVHEPHHGCDEGCRNAHARQGFGAQLPHECGIGEHEQRLGNQRAEGGYSERQNTPVERFFGLGFPGFRVAFPQVKGDAAGARGRIQQVLGFVRAGGAVGCVRGA